MSKKSDKFESDLVNMVNNHIGEILPNNLPEWMIEEGIIPSSEIISCRGIGSISKTNKTDVIIELSEGEPIKISAKLNNADYFGNWYGHIRFLEEFGAEAFERMTTEATIWANKWAKTAIAPFVGVSICFGRRTGNTAQDFTDIFTANDILTVARGFGVGEHVANCMIIGSAVPDSIFNLINTLEEISIETVTRATESFKVAYRPINPMTENSNRGKNVYTKFQPYESLDKPTIITSSNELFKLGEFVTVEPTRINHNHILNNLEEQYNIIIPRK